MGNPVVFFLLPISWQLDSALLIGTARKVPLIFCETLISQTSQDGISWMLAEEHAR